MQKHSKEEALLKEAEKRAKHLGISTAEFLAGCVEMAEKMSKSVPDAIEELAKMANDIEVQQRHLSSEIARGARKTHEDSPLFL